MNNDSNDATKCPPSSCRTLSEDQPGSNQRVSIVSASAAKDDARNESPVRLISRRGFIGGSFAALAAMAAARESSLLFAGEAKEPQHLYWGDIHTHTGYSDGRGTPAAMYDFGRRVSALDFCSVSDHAFTVTPEAWKDIAATANRFNEPGRYVTFLAYEWSGFFNDTATTNIYTSDDWMPIIRSANNYSYENLRMYHGAEDEAKRRRAVLAQVRAGDGHVRPPLARRGRPRRVRRPPARRSG